MLKFAVTVFAVLFLALPAGAQPDQRVVREVRKDRQGIVKHEAQLETLDGTVKYLMEYCARAGSREELIKKLERRKQFNKTAKTGNKKPSFPAANLPDPPKSCSRDDLAKYVKQLQETVADHERRLKALEAAQIDLKMVDTRIEWHIRALLIELGKKFPEFKLHLQRVETAGNLDELKEKLAELAKQFAALEEMYKAQKDIMTDVLAEVQKAYLSAKNKQDKLRFTLAAFLADHYNYRDDINRGFALLAAELGVPMTAHFTLTVGGGMGKGPKGIGTLFRAGGELGGWVHFRFAGAGIWDWKPAGIISRWIGGTVGIGFRVKTYQDRPEYTRPPVEVVFFLDAGLGWLAEYGRNSAAPLVSGGVGVRF